MTRRRTIDDMTRHRTRPVVPAWGQPAAAVPRFVPGATLSPCAPHHLGLADGARIHCVNEGEGPALCLASRDTQEMNTLEESGMNEPKCLPFRRTPGARVPGPDAEDHAHVHYPPPLIHGVGVLGGVWLAAAFPLAVPGSPWLTGLGACLMSAALFIAGWGFGEFARHRNPVPPNQPIKGLMTGSPFRFTRNPLYLALALLHSGLGLVSANVWLLITFVPALLTVRYYAIAREEAYLTRRFGAVYRDYQARVRRWL